MSPPQHIWNLVEAANGGALPTQHQLFQCVQEVLDTDTSELDPKEAQSLLKEMKKM